MKWSIAKGELWHSSMPIQRQNYHNDQNYTYLYVMSLFIDYINILKIFSNAVGGCLTTCHFSCAKGECFNKHYVNFLKHQCFEQEE